MKTIKVIQDEREFGHSVRNAYPEPRYYFCRRFLQYCGAVNDTVTLSFSRTPKKEKGWRKIRVNRIKDHNRHPVFVSGKAVVKADTHQLGWLRNNGFGYTFWLKLNNE